MIDWDVLNGKPNFLNMRFDYQFGPYIAVSFVGCSCYGMIREDENKKQEKCWKYIRDHVCPEHRPLYAKHSAPHKEPKEG